VAANVTREKRHDWKTVLIGILLIAIGPTINYMFERHNVFKLWENSTYSVSWADVFYPPLCVFLFLIGIVLAIRGTMRVRTNRGPLRYGFAIAVPLTLFYTVFALGMQAIQTGADRFGECPGLDQAASSSNAIPEAAWRPGHAAVSCGVERRGVFLSYFNEMSVYGVTERQAQQRVLNKISEQYRQAHTHPVLVVFYAGATWSVRQGKNGDILGSGRSGKVIRIVNIG
jgi:hypothetical protein